MMTLKLQPNFHEPGKRYVRAFTPGDDIVRRTDGRLVWANTQGGTVNVVTLTP